MPLVEILVPESKVAHVPISTCLSQGAIDTIEQRINDLLNMGPIAGDYQNMYRYELASWVYVAIEAGIGESVESLLITYELEPYKPPPFWIESQMNHLASF